jgi:hypothetical protein
MNESGKRKLFNIKIMLNHLLVKFWPRATKGLSFFGVIIHLSPKGTTGDLQTE